MQCALEIDNKHFFLKKLSATKHSPQSNIYCMKWFSHFLIECSLIVNVKPTFTKRNEMCCRISEIEDLFRNACKTQKRTYLSSVP